MDTNKGVYRKVDPAEEAAFRRKTRIYIVVYVVCALVILAIIGVAAGTIIHKNKNDNDDSGKSPYNSSQLSSSQSIKALCSQTMYPDSCYYSISNINKSNTTDPEELFKLSLQVVLDALSGLSSLPETLMESTSNQTVKGALKVCTTVLNDAVDFLNDSISLMDVKDGEKLLSASKIEDLKTWLSTALTNQETCLDTLEEVDSTFLPEVKSQMQNSTEYASNSLAIVSKIMGMLGKLNIPIHRKLLQLGETILESEFPQWVGGADRKLLQVGKPTPNVTVAKDGSGDVKTIGEAVARAPLKSDKRFIIYVKEGVYTESIVLNKSVWNVMIYGDGMYRSVISASLNVADGYRTFTSATFGVVGKGLIAMEMGFKNSAGPEKHQAVAMRSGSDCSVFYRCSFDGFQDTLYSHSNRQLYRECDISGTVDFIFGNAAVVYQNCNIMPRQPLPNQYVTITAQGKKQADQTTGISIQKCTITPLDNLTAPAYLGRPWKDFSTTVIMQSTIGGFLNPLGWVEWVPGTDPPSTIFYAEYSNTGPGSAIDKRVKWAGYKPSLTRGQAARFTVQTFIKGLIWLPATNVKFDSGL